MATTWISQRMATDNTYIEYWIKMTENSYSTYYNNSNVTVEVWIERTNTGYQTFGTGTVSCKIDGTTYTANITTDQVITSTERKIFSKTLTIAHSGDGSKTVELGAMIDHSRVSSTWKYWNRSLTKISRYSTPTLDRASQWLDANIVIYTNRADSSYTHKLIYSLGEATGTIATGVTTQYSWRLPKTLANQFTASTSGKGTITCYTYDGDGNYLGKDSVYFSGVVPNTVEFAPKILTTGITGIGLLDGNYIQNKSSVKVSPTYTGTYGSTVTSILVEMNGTSYTTKTSTSDVLKTSGAAIPIKITITDSRGKKTTTTPTIAVMSYQNPYVTSATFVRTDNLGVEQLDGTYVKATVVGGVSTIIPVANRVYKVEYKLSTATTWTSVTIGNTSSNKVNTTTIIPGISTDNVYDFRVSIADNYKTVTKASSVPTAVVLLDFLASGDGVSIGKVAEKPKTLDIAFETIINGKLTMGDSIVLPNVHAIFGKYSDGTVKRLISYSGNNNLLIGYDNVNSTAIYGGTGINLQNDTVINGVLEPSGNVIQRVRGTGYQKLDSGGTARYIVQDGATDNYIYFGSSSTLINGTVIRGTVVKLGSSSGVTVTSDGRLKENIEAFTDKHELFFNNLEPISFRYKNHIRQHNGFIAQQVKEALVNSGLDTEDFAGYVESPVARESFFEEYGFEPDFDTELSLRYEEFISLNTHMIQKQQKQIKDLTSRLSVLEEIITRNELT